MDLLQKSVKRKGEVFCECMKGLGGLYPPRLGPGLSRVLLCLRSNAFIKKRRVPVRQRHAQAQQHSVKLN